MSKYGGGQFIGPAMKLEEFIAYVLLFWTYTWVTNKKYIDEVILRVTHDI